MLVEQIVVGMADCRIGDAPGQVLATYALGSCIGLAVHDAKAGVGGLLHFMLPDSGIDQARGRENPWMFADTGIPMLLDRLCARGASKRRLTVRAAGGASMMDQENVFDIGRRNYLAMRKILWKAGVMVHGEAVGGIRSRTVRLEIGSGKFLIQEGGEVRELAAGLPKMGGM
jgi:chemotaxis protein CheD